MTPPKDDTMSNRFTALSFTTRMLFLSATMSGVLACTTVCPEPFEGEGEGEGEEEEELNDDDVSDQPTRDLAGQQLLLADWCAFVEQCGSSTCELSDATGTLPYCEQLFDAVSALNAIAMSGDCTASRCPGGQCEWDEAYRQATLSVLECHMNVEGEPFAEPRRYVCEQCDVELSLCPDSRATLIYTDMVFGARYGIEADRLNLGVAQFNEPLLFDIDADVDTLTTDELVLRRDDSVPADCPE
jgi:hypothetical protein